MAGTDNDYSTGTGTADADESKTASATTPVPAAVSNDTIPAVPATAVTTPTVPDNTAEVASSDQGETAAPVSSQSADTNANPTAAVASAPPVALPLPPGPPTVQEMNADDADFAQKLATREIKPETLSGLFGKKDTLGKIGTIFGLLVSGAGSGLSHQSNALLDMMNKEIDRDVEAQKQNVANKQSLLALNYQHQLQNSQIKRSNYENAKIAAETGAIPSEAKLKTAQANALDAEHAGISSLNRTKNAMLATTYQHLADQSANNPQAQQVLNSTIVPIIQQKMQQNNDQTAAQLQLHSAKQAQQESSNAAAPIDINKMQKLITLGKNAPEMPGAIPPGEVGDVTKEARLVQGNRKLAAMYDDSFKRLNAAALAGKINPNMREAEVEAMASQVGAASGSQSSEATKKIASSMLPAWNDFGGATAEKYRKGIDHIASFEAATPTLDRYGLKSQFPNYSFGQEGKTLQTKNGIQYEKVAGGWQPVKTSNIVMGK